MSLVPKGKLDLPPDEVAAWLTSLEKEVRSLSAQVGAITLTLHQFILQHQSRQTNGRSDDGEDADQSSTVTLINSLPAPSNGLSCPTPPSSAKQLHLSSRLKIDFTFRQGKKLGGITFRVVRNDRNLPNRLLDDVSALIAAQGEESLTCTRNGVSGKPLAWAIKAAKAIPFEPYNFPTSDVAIKPEYLVFVTTTRVDMGFERTKIREFYLTIPSAESLGGFYTEHHLCTVTEQHRFAKMVQGSDVWEELKRLDNRDDVKVSGITILD
ncbi:hypothetical protein BT69DRAFT_1336750 [Atractiella rhizophila]|nr:hypothetical protein BT69DRAFT_1336750 [Atractiella rhizophila]